MSYAIDAAFGVCSTAYRLLVSYIAAPSSSTGSASGIGQHFLSKNDALKPSYLSNYCCTRDI